MEPNQYQNNSQTIKYSIIVFLLVCLGVFTFLIFRTNQSQNNNKVTVRKYTKEEMSAALERLTPKSHVSLLTPKDEQDALKRLSTTSKGSIPSR